MVSKNFHKNFCWDASQLRYEQLWHNTEKTEKLPKVVGLTPYVSESLILSQFTAKTAFLPKMSKNTLEMS